MKTYKKAQVVMLPTNEKAKLVQMNNTKELHYCLVPKSKKQCINMNHTANHIYIISDDEIKEGDWCLDMEEFSENKQNWKSVFVYQSVGEDHWNNKKIIATTDSSLSYTNYKISPVPNFCDYPQPSQSFIQKYVEEYNKGNQINDVLVEYVKCCRRCNGIDDECKGDILKINSDNTITIKQVKDSWSREEVESKLWRMHDWFNKDVIPTGFLSKERTIKWIEENL